MAKLLKKQRKELYRKIGGVAVDKLLAMKKEQWLYREISDITGLPSNRLSEIVTSRVINDRGIIGLLSGGILTTGVIKAALPGLTEIEVKWIDERFSTFNKPASPRKERSSHGRKNRSV